MDIIYRKATHNDIEEVMELIRSAVMEMNNHGIFQWDDIYPSEADIERDIETNTLYVGSIANEVAVIFVLNQESDKEYEDGDWSDKESDYRVVHRLCVNPMYQNKRVAKRTLLFIEEELIRQEIASIRLDVFTENPYALRLYDHMGYTKVGYADWRMGRFYLMEKQIGCALKSVRG